jgi:hypothetical protein
VDRYEKILTTTRTLITADVGEQGDLAKFAGDINCDLRNLGEPQLAALAEEIEAAWVE